LKKEIPPPFLPNVKDDVDTKFLETYHDITTEKVEFDKSEHPLTNEEKKGFF